MNAKPVSITSRDRDLLNDLQHYGLHSTKHLATRHFPGVQLSTVLRRLRLLEAKDFIQRVPGLEDARFAWALGKAGARLLAPYPTKTHYPRFVQEHDLRLTLLRLRLEEAGIARGWVPEHEIRAKVASRSAKEGGRDQTIPDGLMAIETESLREAVAVELELTHKNQSRYHRIFDDYTSKKNLLGFWYVVGHPSIGNQLMTAASTFVYFGGHFNFYWSLLDEVMKHPASAIVHSPTGSRRLDELFTPGVPKTAQLPAHPVGTQEIEEEALELDLSAENEMEITEAEQG